MRRHGGTNGTLPATVQHGMQTCLGATGGPVRSATAAPGPDGRVRLAVVGDGADGSPESLAVTAQIAAFDPDVFAYLGDVYDNGTPFEFDTWYDDPAGYGQFRGITNPAIGNHEYRTDGAAPYFAYWGGVPHNYSYDVGGWHLVVLDSTTEFADATGVASQLVPGSAQYDWLAQDLAAHQGSCTIAYMHHPRYSNVVGVSRDGLAPGLAAARRPERDDGPGRARAHVRALDGVGPDRCAAPGGITQFVVGTGGREIINPKGTDPRVAAQTAQPAAGALRLDLGPDDAAFSYATTDGTFTDSGTVPCRHPAPPPDTTAALGAHRRGGAGRVPDVRGRVLACILGHRGSRRLHRAARRRSGRDRAGERDVLPGRSAGRRASVRVDRRGLRYRRQPLVAVGRCDCVDAVRPAQQPQPARGTAPSAGAGPRVHRVVLPRLARRRRRRLQHGGRSARRRGPATTAGRDVAARSRAATGARRTTGGTGPAAARWSSTTSSRCGEAWRSGARAWRPALRRQLANDLGYPATLVAVTSSAARAKAGREPQDWLPRPAYRCTYVAEWVAVKWRWRLAVDPAERRFLTRTLRGCGWPQVRAPGRAVG